MRALPTLMATHGSNAYRENDQGVLKNMITNKCEEPDAVARERATGFEDNATAAPWNTDRQRCKLLGNSIDLTALHRLIAICHTLTMVYMYQHHHSRNDTIGNK